MVDLGFLGEWYEYGMKILAVLLFIRIFVCIYMCLMRANLNLIFKLIVVISVRLKLVNGESWVSWWVKWRWGENCVLFFILMSYMYGFLLFIQIFGCTYMRLMMKIFSYVPCSLRVYVCILQPTVVQKWRKTLSWCSSILNCQLEQSIAHACVVWYL